MRRAARPIELVLLRNSGVLLPLFRPEWRCAPVWLLQNAVSSCRNYNIFIPHERNVVALGHRRGLPVTNLPENLIQQLGRWARLIVATTTPPIQPGAGLPIMRSIFPTKQRSALPGDGEPRQGHRKTPDEQENSSARDGHKLIAKHYQKLILQRRSSETRGGSDQVAKPLVAPGVGASTRNQWTG